MPLPITHLDFNNKDLQSKNLRESQVSNLIIHPKALEKQEQRTPKNSSLEEITKIRAELTEIETKKQYKESMKQSSFFEKLKIARKYLAKLIKRKKLGIQMNKLEMKRRQHNQH